MINICNSCFRSISRKDKYNHPPKFAIANNWATGKLPLNLRDLTFAEIRMATVAPISSVIKVVGRSNHVLKSHTMALLATPKPALMQVC